MLSATGPAPTISASNLGLMLLSPFLLLEFVSAFDGGCAELCRLEEHGCQQFKLESDCEVGCEMMLLMKTKVIFPILVAMSAFLRTSALADEIQFTTLPQPVQTTVIRETHISGPSSVLRVLKEENGIYAVTVREETGEHVVYVNGSGVVVQAPATTTIQRTEPATETEQTIITHDEIQANQSRYELLKKEHDKEVYLDHQTGKKVTVKHED